ncbi:MAG: LCP family protein [Oscillospiraceae bacterium]
MNKKKKKLSVSQLIIIIILSVFLLIALILGGIYLYYDGLLQENEAGILPEQVKPNAEINTPDNISFLVGGIDYDKDEGRDYANKLGMTDVILYCSYNLKDNKLNILQIPRDTYIGELTETGKINLLYATGEDKVNHIANLANVLNKDFALDIENYAVFDLDAFTEIIDALGGINMYVPWEVHDEYGNSIPMGTHRLTGTSAVFVIRQRDMYAQKDIKRLEMQQYFYKAVVNAIRTDFSLADVPNMAGRVINYCSTDFNLIQLGSLFPKMMALKDEDIFIARCPGGSVMINGEAVYGINAENLATLLNEHFRLNGETVPASQLGIPTGFDYKLGEINDKGHNLGAMETK